MTAGIGDGEHVETTDALRIVQRLVDPGTASAMRVGPAQATGALALVPLYHGCPRSYLPLSRAAGKGLVKIDELISVPELLITNSAQVAVLAHVTLHSRRDRRGLRVRPCILRAGSAGRRATPGISTIFASMSDCVPRWAQARKCRRHHRECRRRRR
jgi:hypothetical protein